MLSICALALRVTSTQYALGSARRAISCRTVHERLGAAGTLSAAVVPGGVCAHTCCEHTDMLRARAHTCMHNHAHALAHAQHMHMHMHMHMHVHVCACSRICRWGLWLASVCLRAVTRESETGRTCVRECGARIHPLTTIPHLREKISRWKRNHASGSALVLVASRSSASASWLLDDKRNWLPTWLAMIS